MIAESNHGGHVAAFFDLDGTLIPEPSLERRFFRELRRNGRIPLINYFDWAVEVLCQLPKGLLAVQHGNKRYLTGIHRDLVFRHMDSILFFEEGIARIAWHARQGHEIILVSGTLEALAALAASALECELEARGLQVRPRVCATRLADRRGYWTGDVVGEALYGTAKAHMLVTIAKQERIDLRECHAYGNSLLDRHFLCAIGHAHAVNPGRELAAVANQKNWPIWHWHVEKQIASTEKSYLRKEIHHIEGQA
jgi:putative phosphoserine phosphatase / 1-acylglycerol-3-phosphate O-acyltransferase